MEVRFYFLEEVSEVELWASFNKSSVEGFFLRTISNPFSVTFELGWKMTFVPLGVSLITEPFVIVIVPLAESFDSDEFHVGEFIPYHPCCWQVIGCSINPSNPQFLFCVMLKSIKQIISHEDGWVAVLNGQRPLIPINKVLLTVIIHRMQEEPQL